jgi:hypothetical protein
VQFVKDAFVAVGRGDRQGLLAWQLASVVIGCRRFVSRCAAISNNMPEAKSALFDRVPGLQETASNLADVAVNLRSGSKAFRNASGTAAAETQTHTVRDLLVGSLLGEGGHQLLGPEGIALAGAPVAANVLARSMTSPTAVNWAARPAFGSGSQAASGLSIPAQQDARLKLAQALQAGR